MLIAPTHPPDSLICSISQELMTDPVMASDGHTYERRCMEDWINLKGADATSPKTNERLLHHHLTPNYALKSIIEDFIEAQRQCSLQPYHKNNKSTINVAAPTAAAEISVLDQTITSVTLTVPERLPPLISLTTSKARQSILASPPPTTTTVELTSTTSTSEETAVVHLAIPAPAVLEALIPVVATTAAPRDIQTPSAEQTTEASTATEVLVVMTSSTEAEHTVQPTGIRARTSQQKKKQRKVSKHHANDDDDKENKENRLRKETPPVVRVAIQPSRLRSRLKMVFVVIGVFVGLLVVFLAWENTTDLIIAAESGNLSLVQLLVEQGIDIDISTIFGDYSSLYIAAQNGHLTVVQYLVEQGADKDRPNVLGASPIYAATYHGHLPVVKYLLEQGADKAKTTDIGDSPLHIASARGHLSTTKYLVQQGADKNMANTDGLSPLHYAASMGHLKVVHLLVKQGADKDNSNYNGWSPLHAAAQHGHVKVVRYLVGQGADMDKAANDGATPLHIAARHGHAKVISCLMDLGASTTAKDRYGNAPLMW